MAVRLRSSVGTRRRLGRLPGWSDFVGLDTGERLFELWFGGDGNAIGESWGW
jgi:hypothetical protein